MPVRIVCDVEGCIESAAVAGDMRSLPCGWAEIRETRAEDAGAQLAPQDDLLPLLERMLGTQVSVALGAVLAGTRARTTESVYKYVCWRHALPIKREGMP